MDDGRQATFGPDGSIEADTPPAATGENDFGEESGPDETDGGHSRYAVSSLLQKAVRRSDAETAAWAAWELARSGYAWNLWDRLALYVVEDLRAGHRVGLLIERYERLATERWEPDEWRGRLCAIHAALAAARAPSTREAAYADEYFRLASQRRAAAIERGEEPAHALAGDELTPGGRYDVALDGHTGQGSSLDRGTRFFKTRGARVGPAGETDAGRRWQRLALALAEIDFSEAELEHAGTSVDPDDRWREPDGIGPAEGGG